MQEGRYDVNGPFQQQRPGNGAEYIILTDMVGKKLFVRIHRGLMDCKGIIRWVRK